MSEFLGSHHRKDIATVAVNPFVWDGGASISSSIYTAGFDCSKPSQINANRKMYIYLKVVLKGILKTPKKSTLLTAGETTIDIAISEIL
jgi:hypothetical protein